jgi:hypothetical protein
MSQYEPAENVPAVVVHYLILSMIRHYFKPKRVKTEVIRIERKAEVAYTSINTGILKT